MAHVRCDKYINIKISFICHNFKDEKSKCSLLQVLNMKYSLLFSRRYPIAEVN